MPNLIIRLDWHMSSLTFESVRLGRFVIGSTCCSIRPGLSSRKAKDQLRFIRGTFLCAESNAYITNTVNKLVLIAWSSARFHFCHAHTVCFDPLEQNVRKTEKICVPIASKVQK